jgi:hypothetical protein
MHHITDAISLEIATRVAARLRAEPELVAIARNNLIRWKKQNADTPSLLRCYDEWESILEKPISEVVRRLCAQTGQGQRLRQNSPFVGILSQVEVRELKRKLRENEAATA